MVKNLVNKLKSGVKKTKRFATAFGLSSVLLFNGYFLNNCKPIITPNPTASLYVSPESGISPLETNIQLDGSPREYISKYILKISSDNASGLQVYRADKFAGINSDSGFEISEEETREIIRQNNLDVKPEGGGVGVQPKRSKKSGVRGKKVAKDQIQRPKKQEGVYSNYEPGVPKMGFERMFPVFGGTQSYEPDVIRISSNGIEETLESGRPINITRVYDNVTGNNINIFLRGEVVDQYGVRSVPVSKTIVVYSEDREIYLSGTLRDNETDSAVSGMLKVFDTNKELLKTNKSNESGYILTNSSGRFDFQVKGIVPGIEKIIIEAAHGTPGNLQSWVRTKSIPIANNSNLDIVAVPYGDFASNPDEFRDFMYEVTGDGYPGSFDFKNFNRGFIIIKENLDDSIDGGNPEGKGEFSEEQIKYIKNLITPGVSNVEKFIGTSNYTINTQATSENHNPGAGVIYIIPSTAPGGNPDFGGLHVPTAGKENLKQGVDIFLRDNLDSNEWALRRVTLHEIGHLLYSHTTKQNSVMASPGTNFYSSLDLKGTDIVYESTYLRSDWKNGYPVENLKYILGKSFDEWN